MVKKILTWIVVLSIALAIWKASGGNIGVAATNAWDWAVNVLDMTSDWALTFWNNINPF